MCLFAIIAGLLPRFAFAIYWIARPNVVDAAFSSFILPLLGLVFVPFTTLMYTLLWTSGAGVSGWDWLWVAFALVLDLGHYGASAYNNRDQIPGMSPTP